ncbi:MAG TPA: hypothetical protein VHO69_02425, partial [Phototrophicaceae bacterium]|nr:hypothetical protein [Phototrophicaceae bacterium]
MASEQAKEFRKQGIAAAKSGQKDQARQLLQQSLRLEPGSETAWLWLMSVARDQREKMICLYKLLTINPNNQMGLDALQSLGMTLEQLAQQLGSKAEAVPPAAAPASVAPPPARTAAQPPSPAVAQAPGVPVPEPQRLAQAQAELDALVREYLAPFAEYSGITWTRKTSKRAGERDSLTLRLYMAGGVTAVLVIVFIIGAVVIMNNPAARAVLFAPTETPTRTPAPPTPTFTPTLGLTPTPSPTPELTLTPSPTVNVNIAQNSGIEPTEIYPDVSERGIRESVGLINAGQVEVALPTLVAEVTLVQSNFNPNPYYYQAMGLVKQGELDRAAEVLRDAERRLPEKPNDNFAPLVNAGLAYVDALRAERALADRRLDEARALLANVEDRAQNAIDGDPRLEQPYLALARRYALDQDYTRAIGVIDEGLAVPELAANLNLILEKGEDYFQQGEFELATYQAFLALYVNPAAEPAHILQIRTAL